MVPRGAENRTSASFFHSSGTHWGEEEEGGVLWHRVRARGRTQANSETGIDNKQTQSHKESQSDKEQGLGIDWVPREERKLTFTNRLRVKYGTERGKKDREMQRKGS